MFNQGERLWAITAFFNPTKSKLMIENYRLFRSQLNLNLVAIELSFDDSFQLDESDATIVHQISGGPLNMLWQKERLINIGCALLPDSCEFIAWLDCDLIFENKNWSREAINILEKKAVIQLFDSVTYLGKGNLSKANAYKVPGSVFNALAQDPIQYPSFNSDSMQTVGNPGMAWAARRKLVERVQLYDVAPVGGGDTLFFSAMFPGIFRVKNLITVDNKHWNHYIEWCGRLNAMVQGEVSWLKGSILHLWHGDLSQRQYVDRNKILKSHEFDFSQDFHIDSNYCWEWSSHKPAMHNEIKKYFFSRFD